MEPNKVVTRGTCPYCERRAPVYGRPRKVGFHYGPSRTGERRKCIGVGTICEEDRDQKYAHNR